MWTLFAMPIGPQGACPTHTADAIIHDLTGLPVCVDGCVATTPPHAAVQPHLCDQEAAKRKEYGAPPGPPPF
eukprot:3807882-Amphidinium_carterae.1